MTAPEQRRSPLRIVAWIVSILAIAATIGLMFYADLPLWGGLIITAVVILPCQIYLNRTIPRK